MCERDYVFRIMTRVVDEPHPLHVGDFYAMEHLEAKLDELLAVVDGPEDLYRLYITIVPIKEARRAPQEEPAG